MSALKATWEFLRGRMDEAEFGVRVCNHRCWRYDADQCADVCGATATYIVSLP